MIAESRPVECVSEVDAAHAGAYAMQLLKLESQSDFSEEYRGTLMKLAAITLDWRWDGVRYCERYQLPSGRVASRVGDVIAAWAAVRFEQRRRGPGKKLVRVAVY